MLRTAPALALLLVAACQRTGDRSPGPPAGPPTAVVERYFAAVAADDCDGLTAASGGDLARTLSTTGCPQVLADYHRHALRLVAIHGSVRDGRSTTAHLVRIRISDRGKERDIQVRVEPQAGTWRMVSF